ncbi:MAG: hypothetical protein WB755_13705, partial [Terriglobales bacterium]
PTHHNVRYHVLDRPMSATKRMEEATMSEAMWKKEDGVSTEPMPWAMYAEAMNKFTTSATAFMEHVHLLTEARDAYQEAMTASTALRNRLDAGDQTLRSLMAQLAQVVNDHLGEPVLDRKKPELVKVESTRQKNEGTGTGGMFP